MNRDEPIIVEMTLDDDHYLRVIARENGVQFQTRRISDDVQTGWNYLPNNLLRPFLDFMMEQGDFS